MHLFNCFSIKKEKKYNVKEIISCAHCVTYRLSSTYDWSPSDQSYNSLHGSYLKSGFKILIVGPFPCNHMTEFREFCTWVAFM